MRMWSGKRRKRKRGRKMKKKKEEEEEKELKEEKIRRSEVAELERRWAGR